MAGGYDGSVTFKTSIDEKGFNAGLKNLSASIAKIKSSFGALASAVMGTVSTIAKLAGVALIAALGGMVALIGSSVRALFELDGYAQSVKTSFENLKLAFATAFQPLVTAALPIIQTIISWMTRLLTLVQMYIAAFLGQKTIMQAVSNTAANTAKSTGQMAKNTKEAGKAAEGALASFDELNVLQLNKDNPDAGGSAGAIPDVTFQEVSLQGSQFEEIKKKVEAFTASLSTMFEPASAAFDRLKEALKPLGKTIWEGLKWAWDNILVPLGKWAISDLLPVFLDILAASARILNAVLIALQPAWMWLWDNVLKPIANWTGQAFIDFLDWWAKGLDKVADALESGDFKDAYEVAWNYILDTGKEILGKLWNWITEQWGKLENWWIEHVTIPVETAFLVAWINISKWASTTWEDIKKVWADVSKWFQDTVIDPLKDGFDEALSWLSEQWDSTFNGIEDFVKESINSIINFVNRFLTNFSTGVNNLINNLNGAMSFNPLWVPLQTTSPYQLPHLATGAVIPPNAQFAAILGDQRSGKNIEAPESLIRQIIQEEMSTMQPQRVTIDFGNSSLSALIRTLNPVIKQENDRIGSSLIDGVSA